MAGQVSVHKQATFSGHRDCIYTLAEAADASYFYSAGGDGLVVKWNTNDPDKGELIAKTTNSIYALCFIRRYNYLLIGENFEGLHLIDLESNQEIRSLKLPETAIFDLQAEGNDIYVACGNGALVTVDLSSFSVKNTIQIAEKSVRSISLRPDSNELAIGCSDNTIKILEKSTLKVLYEIESHTASVFSVCYTPDGSQLFSGSRDAHLKIWNVAEGYELQQDIVAHLYAINHICFNSGGKLFATCSMDKSIKIWETENAKLLKVIDRSRHSGHATSVNKLLWSADNNLLISCSDDKTISLWDISESV